MNLRKSIASLALSSILIIAMTANANAFLTGLIDPLAVPLMVILGPTFVIGYTCQESGNNSVFCQKLQSGMKIAAPFILGVIVLNKEINTIQFNEISDETANKLSLTLEEKMAYNNELDQINLANEDLTQKVLSASANDKLSVQKAAGEDFQKEISPEALSAVRKVMSFEFSQNK